MLLFTFPPSPPDSFGAAFPRRGIVPGGDWQGRQGKGDVHALGQLEHAFVRTPGTKSNLSLSAISPISHRMALSSRRGLCFSCVLIYAPSISQLMFMIHSISAQTERSSRRHQPKPRRCNAMHAVSVTTSASASARGIPARFCSLLPLLTLLALLGVRD